MDGTSNYACGFPYFCVSLALLRGGEAELGVILDPVRGECFCAERGGGAYLDGAPLRASSDSADLRDCLAMVDLKRLPAQDLSRLGKDAPYRSQRNLGSVALDWCWMPAGRGQLYLHGGQKLWDYCAGRLIPTEAGIPSRLFASGGTEAPAGLSLEGQTVDHSGLIGVDQKDPFAKSAQGETQLNLIEGQETPRRDDGAGGEPKPVRGRVIGEVTP